MKKIIFSILALSLIAVSISGQKKSVVEKEKEAIKAVIEKQHNAFRERDYESLVTCFVQQGPMIRFAANTNGYLYREYEDASEYKTIFERNPDPVTTTSKFKNYKIKVYERSAWAVVDLHKSDGVHEIHARFLEKEEGEWKIVFFSFIVASSYDDEDAEEEEETTTEE